jgi:diaminopimelate decarboxylase
MVLYCRAMATDTTPPPVQAGLPPLPRALRDDLARAAATFGTPLYVVQTGEVVRAAAAVEDAFPEPWIRQYSLKANDLPAVTELLAARGWGANVVSSGEWAHARAAGVPSERTTFEGVGKTDDDLRAVVEEAATGTSLRWVAAESSDELVRLAELHRARCEQAGHDVDLPVLLRLNPDVQPETAPGLAVGLAASKFGLSAADLEELATAPLWTRGLRLCGVHVHMGSRLRDVAAWAEAGCRAARLLARVREVYTGAGTPDTVDFGGGFPAYGAAPAPGDFAAALHSALDRAGLELPPVAAIEPGRVVIGAAGWLVAGVLHTRMRGQDRQVILDAGMTELIRPALYGSRHAVTALGDGAEAGSEGGPEHLDDVVVEGAVCESTDTFGVHPLPPLRRGDLVVLHEAGAYGASFSSRYNGRPPAPEALLWPDGTLSLGERTPPPPRGRPGDLIRTVDGARSRSERSSA